MDSFTGYAKSIHPNKNQLRIFLAQERANEWILRQSTCNDIHITTETTTDVRPRARSWLRSMPTTQAKPPQSSRTVEDACARMTLHCTTNVAIDSSNMTTGLCPTSGCAYQSLRGLLWERARERARFKWSNTLHPKQDETTTRSHKTRAPTHNQRLDPHSSRERARMSITLIPTRSPSRSEYQSAYRSSDRPPLWYDRNTSNKHVLSLASRVSNVYNIILCQWSLKQSQGDCAEEYFITAMPRNIAAKIIVIPAIPRNEISIENSINKHAQADLRLHENKKYSRRTFTKMWGDAVTVESKLPISKNANKQQASHARQTETSKYNTNEQERQIRERRERGLEQNLIANK